MASMAQLRHVHIPKISSSASQQHRSSGLTRSVTFGNHHPPRLSCRQLLRPNLLQNHARGNGGGGGGGGGSGDGGGGGSGGGDENESEDSDSCSSSWVGPIGAFLNGWRSRVEADPQFPFKVVMEELVGVTAAVFGDMSTRPNFGLNELDLVFSTMVVVSIVNFLVMYLLAPTTAAVSTPNLFSKLLANCPSSHMFEPGNYGILNRFSTFIYKGAVFAVVGFAAGLVGTTVTNGLVKMRKKMDPKFETQNEAPATLLNAGTWSIHMGVSSNLRYQTLNGVEYGLGNAIVPGSVLFKTSVVVLRCLNNVLGGMSFVMLARLTGAQSVDEGKSGLVVSDEDVKLLEHHIEEDK